MKMIAIRQDNAVSIELATWSQLANLPTGRWDVEMVDGCALVERTDTGINVTQASGPDGRDLFAYACGWNDGHKSGVAEALKRVRLIMTKARKYAVAKVLLNGGAK